LGGGSPADPRSGQVKLLLRPAAAADLDEAYLWYETQQDGLGDEFLAAVIRVLDLVAESPRLYPIVHRDTRRALVKRFPYSILYRLIGDNAVVVSFFQGSRDPKKWQERS
jgi:plasmid stabilization system protein ParE